LVFLHVEQGGSKSVQLFVSIVFKKNKLSSSQWIENQETGTGP